MNQCAGALLATEERLAEESREILG
jgi:hypothetical protein